VTTLVPKDQVVQALRDEFAAIDALLSGLEEKEWSAPTPLPGWDVQANVAHIIGTESMLAGIPNPDVEVDREARPHVRNDIGAFNEQWVVALADEPPTAVLDRFREITTARLAALDAMDQARWDEEGWTPAGTDSYGRFMRIRAFDCWMHEQDIRDAVGRPGHEAGTTVDVALDEMGSALGFLVGKKAGAPDGTTVTFDLDGRKFHVAVAGRAAVVDSLPGPATATLGMSVGTFSRLGGGRIDPGIATVHLAGDTALGQAIVDNLGYTI